MSSGNFNLPPQKSFLKSPLTYSTALVLIGALYVAWILYSRHQADRAYDQRVRQEQTEEQRQRDQAAIQQLGGNDLAIQMFYITPQIHRGEVAQICYGVANAKTVRIEPPAGPVWPSHNRCLDVRPTKTTTYTLTATADGGRSVSQQVSVVVH